MTLIHILGWQKEEEKGEEGKKKQITPSSEDVEKRNNWPHTHCWWECKAVQALRMLGSVSRR